MKKFKTLLRVLKDRSGATVIEYCLIAGIISIAIVGGATTMGNSANGSFNAVSAGITST
ncbi:MAG: Flp family type IVb pilin [Hyphomonadaceae bacterium]